MVTTNWNDRFLTTSRGRIVGLLRREGQTVEALARALGLTTNAIRGHLAILERDGMVTAGGRRASGGKPAQVYVLTTAAEARLSRAHAPVLRSLLDELASRTPATELKDVLRSSGRRLASTRAADGAPLEARIAAARSVLASLGAVTEVGHEGGATVLRGLACPLADVVTDHPEVCCGLETLLSDVTGLPVKERCEREGDRPRCRFVVG